MISIVPPPPACAFNKLTRGCPLKAPSLQFLSRVCVLADGHLLPTGGALLSKRELGNGSELFSQLTVDPLDSRQICLCGSNGAVAVLQLTDPAADKIQAQQYRVNLQQQPAGERGGGCGFAADGLM
jgi:hypothetical protein